MKKVLLALSFLASSSLSIAQSGIDTIYRETFEPPDSVTTLSLGTATTTWKDTSNLSISAPNSYHGKVEPANTVQGNSEVVFRTDSFSTVGYNYVFLDFYHICKINQVNEGIIRISTDGGNTWTDLLNNNVTYLGASPNWNSSSGFQEASYTALNLGINVWSSGTDPTPQSSWWRFEQFDISNLALDANGNGYSDVRIEFSALYILDPTQLTGRPFGAGWWVDNLQVIASTCEIYPPRFSFNYSPIPCFPVQPQGGLVENQNQTYKIGARITDSVQGIPTNNNNYSGIDSATVFYRIRDSSGVGPWQYENMSISVANTSRYVANLNNIQVGDTVEYYYKAWDLSCPNVTRYPDSLANPQNPYLTFFPERGYPFKCGQPDCGSLPGTISSFPWTEDFEGPEWVPGSGDGSSGTNHIGSYPNSQTGSEYWQVQPNKGNFNNDFAWGVRSGPTGTQFTGPSSNHTPGGNTYIYADPSQGLQNTTTTISTPCIDLTQIDTTKCYAFEFWYHMYGEDMGNLLVDVDTGQNTAGWQGRVFFIRKEQQKSSNDPWRRGIIPLDEFYGSFIRIRFRAPKQTPANGNQAQGDVSVDDLRIYEPPQTDAEALQITDPEDGACAYGSQEPFDLIVRNAGCNNIQNLPIEYRLIFNGTPQAVQSTTLNNVNLGLGDTALVTVNNALNMSAFGTYRIEAWTNLSGDNITAFDTARSKIINHNVAFNSFPLVMDFENLPEGTSQTGSSAFTVEPGPDSNYVFKVGAHFTDRRNTGPKHGYYESGQFLYTDGPVSSANNVPTYLKSACLDISGMSDPMLDFYYHFNASDINRVEVQYNDPVNMAPDQWNTVAGATINSGTQNDPLDNYDYHRVDLKNLSSSNSIRVRIAVYRDFGDETHFAIDKLRIYDRISNDAGVQFFLEPYLSFPINNLVRNVVSVSAEVYNYGTSNFANEPVTFSVTPLCGPNAGIATTYTSTNGATVTPGNVSTLTMNQINLELERGDCRVCAYTSLTGDNNNFNDTACQIINGRNTYDIDFYSDFDSCAADQQGFFAQGGFLQWQKGIADPTSQFSSPQSNDYIWATNLTDGAFLDDKSEVLRAPTLDNFDTVVKPTIRFFQNIDMGNNAAGAIEVFRNGQWTTLGKNLGSFQGVGQNWYTTQPFGTLQAGVGGIEEGFTGSTRSGQNPSGWVLSSFPIFSLSEEPNPNRLRFFFDSEPGANSGGNREGWAIDDFEVFIPPQNSGAPVRFKFVSPLQIPQTQQELDIFVKNTGAKRLTEIEVKAQVLDNNNNLVWNGAWQVDTPQGFVFTDDVVRIDYNPVWPASTVNSGNYTLRLISRLPNSVTDNRPADDTTTFPIDVLGEFDFNSATNDVSYCNDFETANPLPFLAMNSNTFAFGATSWQKGTPQQFPGAFSGSNAWMTDLSNNYVLDDQSSLISPSFEIEQDTAYEISFMHYYQTELYHDGGNFEFSTDGGRSWQAIGSLDTTKWYNTAHVTALDIVRPGWSGSSNGWDSASYIVEFDTAVKRVVFRFRFGSDFEIQDAGWAVDDFCFDMSEETPEYVIGTEEHTPLPDRFIGQLHPNPTSDVTRIPYYVESAEPIEVVVTNMMGQQVYRDTKVLRGGAGQMAFETFDWGAGVYFVNINVDGEKVTRKLVVQ
ncbi:MAG: T9SS type A sorting domain-containing protein [Schleiferiaceae bacterium]|nr:T9SS type A sorting domain-containing protein [Schleiferiaceae bacterium]